MIIVTAKLKFLMFSLLLLFLSLLFSDSIILKMIFSVKVFLIFITSIMSENTENTELRINIKLNYFINEFKRFLKFRKRSSTRKTNNFKM